MNTLHSYQLLRYRNLDGTSKDWAIRNNGNGTYTKRWGKTGTRLQSKDFPLKSPNDIFDEQRRKRIKGYEYIGDYFIDDDGNLTPASQQSPTPHQDPHPTQEVLCLYWRIKVLPSIQNSSAAFEFRNTSIRYVELIQAAFPEAIWLKEMANSGYFLKPQSGKLLPEDGVGSLLLLMSLKKAAPDGITISISYEDGVEISDQLKFESNALSFFGTDLDSVRSLSEELGLLAKRLDLSSISPALEDYYF